MQRAVSSGGWLELRVAWSSEAKGRNIGHPAAWLRAGADVILGVPMPLEREGGFGSLGDSDCSAADSPGASPRIGWGGSSLGTFCAQF